MLAGAPAQQLTGAPLFQGMMVRTRKALRNEPLLAAMLMAVLVGIATGSLARGLHPSARGIELLGMLSTTNSLACCTSTNPRHSTLTRSQHPAPSYLARYPRSAWGVDDQELEDAGLAIGCWLHGSVCLCPWRSRQRHGTHSRLDAGALLPHHLHCSFAGGVAGCGGTPWTQQ